MKAFEYGVRNAVKDSCEECGKEVVYEKDEDSELDSIEVEGVWMQLCEECAEPHRERERRYHEEELANAPEAAFILMDRNEGDQEETRTGFGDLGEAFAEASHITNSGRKFVSIQSRDRLLYDEQSILPIIQRMEVFQNAGTSVEESARRIATEETP